MQQLPVLELLAAKLTTAPANSTYLGTTLAAAEHNVQFLPFGLYVLKELEYLGQALPIDVLTFAGAFDDCYFEN
jgi:hypothetical protein